MNKLAFYCNFIFMAVELKKTNFRQIIIVIIVVRSARGKELLLSNVCAADD